MAPEIVAMIAIHDDKGVRQGPLVTQPPKQFAYHFVRLPVGVLKPMGQAAGLVGIDPAMFDVADQIPEKNREGPFVGHAVQFSHYRLRIGRIKRDRDRPGPNAEFRGYLRVVQVQAGQAGAIAVRLEDGEQMFAVAHRHGVAVSGELIQLEVVAVEEMRLDHPGRGRGREIVLIAQRLAEQAVKVRKVLPMYRQRELGDALQMQDQQILHRCARCFGVNRQCDGCWAAFIVQAGPQTHWH